MSEFNPGPWQFFSDMHGHPYIANEDGGVVAWIAPDTCYEAFDTASLIAAAPDLLNALRVLYEEADNFSVSGVYFNEKCMEHKGLDLARAALAKAQGHAHD